KPAISRRVVVLPEPLDPSSEKNSPWPISSVSGCSAATDPNALLICSSRKTAPLTAGECCSISGSVVIITATLLCCYGAGCHEWRATGYATHGSRSNRVVLKAGSWDRQIIEWGRAFCQMAGRKKGSAGG